MSQLPAGTVTFLFTDVEGSTRMWDAFPDDMRVALALHDEAVTTSATDHGGHVVKHTGDGLFLAFGSAPTAFACAIDAQRRLAAADWPSVVGALGVRMALHTADVQPDGDDYHSPEVNRVARIEAAGHGGQVLLSDSTRSLITEPPPGVELRDLGEHLLRGISRPERIHQAVIGELRTTFPPLRTASTVKGHLPTFGTPFVGRAEEVTRLATQVTDPQSRLVTLLGPGGIGKSRLAVEVAAAAAPALGATAHFLPLAPVTDPTHIIKALADSISFTIDLHLSGTFSEQKQVFDRLRAQPVVLVLDNLEHLPGAAGLIAEMVTELPEVTIIATSRQRIGISAERVNAVEGLTVDQDALTLLAECARRAGAELDTSSPEAVGLVALLGGMPLAIELAAAWTPLIDLTEITTEIQRDLDFLSSTAPDLPDRHRSVRAVFDQTWRRLDPGLCSALAAMSVFVAPFSREAAQEVTGATLPTLARLGEASLLHREPLTGAYSLHPLLKEFAFARLEEKDAVLERYARHHLDHLLANAGRIAGRDQIAARDELAEDLDHLRFAMEWGMQHLPDDEMYDALLPYGDFLFLHSWVEQAADMRRLHEVAEAAFGREGLLQRRACLLAIGFEALAQENFLTADEVDEIIDPVLEHTTDDDGLVRAIALTVRSITETYRSNFEAAIDWCERAAGIEMPHHALHSAMLGAWYGWAQLQLGLAETARTTFETYLAQANEDGHEIGRAFLLSKLGVAADELGEHRLAAEYHHEGREIFVKAGDTGGQGYTLSRLSWSHYLMGSFDLARRYGLEGLEKFEEMNLRWGIAVSNGRVGLAEVKLGALQSAASHFLETLRVAEESGLPDQLHYGVIGIGLTLHTAGETNAAGRLLVGSVNADRNPYVSIAQPALAEIEAVLGDGYAEIKADASALDLDTLVREARHHARSLVGAE